jgi:excisionase family DNA binding protein
MDTAGAQSGASRRSPLWSVRDLAEFLGVPMNTVYKWESRGDGPPSYKVGKHRRYRERDVLAWLESRKNEK